MFFETIIMCLALNLFYEANTEPVQGKYMVVESVMERADYQAGRICKEVTKPMQYSWLNSVDIRHTSRMAHMRALQKKLSSIKRGPTWVAWKQAVHISRTVLTGKVKLTNAGLKYYYNPKLANPPWAKKMTVIAHIGDHIFLRERGDPPPEAEKRYEDTRLRDNAVLAYAQVNGPLVTSKIIQNSSTIGVSSGIMYAMNAVKIGTRRRSRYLA